MDVKPEEIQELLEFFSKVTYNAWDPEPKVHQVMQRCLDLFGLDYTYSVVSNSNGELSTNYPSSLIILETEKNHDDADLAKILSTTSLNGLNQNNTNTNGDVKSLFESTLNGDTNGDTNGDGQTVPSPPEAGNIPDSNSSVPSTYDVFSSTQDTSNIKEMCTKARYARCRTRFPIPVILYKNKHICRSATLSGGPEIYGRTSFDYFFASISSSSTPATVPASANSNSPKAGGTAPSKDLEAESTDDDVIVPVPPTDNSEWVLFDRVRKQDIQLLKSFKVNTIVDLMVEKKKVKYGLYVTSSEKVDKKNRYSEFNLISLPYPGCEFFKQYRDNGYNGEELVFEWNQGHVDANIYVPSDQIADSLNLDWSQYTKWDLVRLTQNYMKLILAYLRGERNGLLIHCISGWDRTPLFLSLIRLSLWADGAIHKSLNVEQILYLTLAYDWLLFGHNLVDRLNKGEEILFFCFYFLIHIVDDEFSMDYAKPETSSDKVTNSVPLKTWDDSSSDCKGCSRNGNENGIGAQRAPSGPHECHEMSTLNHVERLAAGSNNGNGESNGHHLTNINGNNHDESKLPEFMSSPFGSGHKSQIVSSLNSHEHSIETGSLASLTEENTATTALRVPSGINEMGGSNFVEEGLEAASRSNGSNFNSTSCSNVEQAEEAKACSVTSVTAGAIVPNSSSIPTSSDPLVERKISDNLKKMNGREPNVEDSTSATSESSNLPVSHSNGSGSADPTSTLETPEAETTSASTKEISSHEESESERLNESPSAKGKVHELNFKPSYKSLNATTRCERLQIVRALFYSTYKSLLTNPHGVNENSSGSGGGSGLSLILDNIATKVGFKTANRSSS